MKATLKYKPNLFIVGAPKCGSTSMWYYLNQHSDVFLVKEKEPQYFNDDLEFRKQFTAQEYNDLYLKSSSEKYIGEASPLYLISKNAAKNIKKASPLAKIIIMIRKPSEILYSIYLQNKVNHLENIDSFEKALDAESFRKSQSQKSINGQPIERLFYSEFANYAEQISRFHACFSADQIHIILFDDLRKNTQLVYKNVLNFLGLPTDNIINFDVQNAAKLNRNYKFQEFIDSPPKIIKKITRKIISNSLRSKIYWKLWWLNKKKIEKSYKHKLSIQISTSINKKFEKKTEKLEIMTGLNLSHWKK